MTLDAAQATAWLAAIILLVLYLREVQRRRAEQAIGRSRREDAERQADALRAEKEAYLADKIGLGRALAEAQAQAAELQRRLADQTCAREELQARLRTEFENMAGRLLDEKSEKFTRLNQVNIEALLKPLQEKIRDFEKKVEETYHLESRERFSLQRELQRMQELNSTLSEQATNLANALKADTRRQGGWGEYVLERILESSGLEAGIHYRTQQSFTDEEGRRRRPDVVVLLPENRQVAVDAKVSLTAYERYYSAADEAARRQALEAHVQSVRRHIDDLASRHYEKLLGDSPDFVLMFIPVEPAYGLALMQDPHLFDYAMREKIILVSVSSLLATLRVIESMWRLDKQNRHAAEIVRQGSALYDKFAGFVADMQQLGGALGHAQQAYDRAVKKLSTGRGNLVGRAEQMRRLGLDAGKSLPEQWVRDSEEPSGE